MEFQGFPKVARLSRFVVVTEKIDGTNAQVHIEPLDPARAGLSTVTEELAIIDVNGAPASIRAGSRSRYLTPGKTDNFGFAAWVLEHAQELSGLGFGRHYGEWWGAGIQRRYGLEEKRFSLFNVHRWSRVGTILDEETELNWDPSAPKDPVKQRHAPECCHVVPVLYTGLFDTQVIEKIIWDLQVTGSVAAPGFLDPEGVMVFHTASSTLYKKTIVGDDEKPKGRA